MARLSGALWLWATIAAIGCSSSSTNSAVTTDAGDDGGTCDWCVEAAPNGWKGPVIVYADVLDAPSEPCPHGFTKADLTAYFDIVPGTLSCGCGCGGPTTDATCQLTVDEIDDNCTAGANVVASQTIASDSVCASVALDPLALAFNVGAPTPSGSCQVEKNEKRDTPTWQHKARICELVPGKQCGDGTLCAPGKLGVFHQQNCIYKEGVEACPPGYGPQPQYYGDYVDQRVCQCGCDALPPAACANATVTAYDQVDCGGLGYPNMFCYGASQFGFGGYAYLNVGAPSGGSCNATQSIGGDVALTSPITVCCH